MPAYLEHSDEIRRQQKPSSRVSNLVAMADDDFDIYGDDEAYEPVREVCSTASLDFERLLTSFATSFATFSNIPTHFLCCSRLSNKLGA